MESFRGDVDLSPALTVIRDHELVFYDRFLKDVANDWDERPPAELYVLGANEWRGEHEWPLARATPTAFHLRSGGALSVDEPKADEPADRYDYDPADPVPTVGGVNSVLTMTQGAETPIRPGPLDQRVLEARDDVLVYTSEPLDRDLEVIGPVEVTLFAASSARDTDFIVRICDVYPDGRSIFLTEGIIRARYRGSVEGESVELLEPGEVAEYRIRLYPMANVFRRGHRIRLDLTSSSFPRFSRNLNTGEDVGTGTRMQVAHQTVLHTPRVPVARAPSRRPLLSACRTDSRPTTPTSGFGRCGRRAATSCRSTGRPRRRSRPTSSTRLRVPSAPPPRHRTRAGSRSSASGSPASSAATGRPVDGEHELVVTNGAMHALGLCFRSLLQPGDEVVVPAPCFFFEGPIRAAGGVPVYVRGSADEGWAWDAEAIEHAVGPRTRALLLCNPGNPTGAVPSADEVASAAGVAERRGLVLVTDEAYEAALWDAGLASAFPLARRTLLVRSLGKSLSLPHLRVGVVAGPRELVDGVALALEWDVLRVGLAPQVAAIAVLDGPRAWLRRRPRRPRGGPVGGERRGRARGSSLRPAPRRAVPLRLGRPARPRGLARRGRYPRRRRTALPGAGMGSGALRGRCELPRCARRGARTLGDGAMRRLGVPRRTLAITAANSLSAAGQGQFMFVLPWMLLALGHEPRDAALATAFVYVPLLVTAIPGGADRGQRAAAPRPPTVARGDARRGAALSAVPPRRSGLVLARPPRGRRGGRLAELRRGRPDARASRTRRREPRSSAHTPSGRRSTRPPLFGSPFLGLLLFRLGGVDAVLIGICALQAVALLLLVPVPRIGGGYERGRDIDALARAFDAVRTNPRLRRIGLANLIWNVFAGSALGILPAVLREHLGLDEVAASAAFIAGMVVVVVLTLPVTRGVQRRLGPFSAFLAASTVQGAALLLFVPPSLAVLAPLLVSALLLSNSTAAASLNGARALEIAQDQQALLSIIVMTLGMIGFVLGLVFAAVLLGVTSFGLVLALTGLGMAVTAAAFRRPAVAT